MRHNGLMKAPHSRITHNIPGCLPEEREETKERIQNFINFFKKIHGTFQKKKPPFSQLNN